MSFIKNLFGSTPQVGPQAGSISSPGMTAGIYGGQVSLQPTAAMQAATTGLSSTFQQAGQAFGNLASQWAPGASNLRNSLMAALQNQRTSSLGNLRDQLARRRVLGSSFAADAMSRADQQFTQDIQRVQDQTFLQELQATAELTQQQFNQYQQSFSTAIAQMNFQTSVAAQLQGQASQVMSQAAITNAQLQAQAQQGAGKALGTAAGFALAPMTGGTSLLNTPLTNSNMTWF